MCHHTPPHGLSWVCEVHWKFKRTVFFLPVLAGRTVFTSFLRSEFSEENMDFWVACEDYKKTAPSKLATRAKQIYQQYVEADAPNEVKPFIWTLASRCWYHMSNH